MCAFCAVCAHKSTHNHADYAHEFSVQVAHKAVVDTAWFKERKRQVKASDDAIAEAIGRERSTANRIINGDIRFDVSFVDGFARVLKVPKSEILARIGIDLPAEDSPPDHQQALARRLIERASPEQLVQIAGILGGTANLEDLAAEQLDLVGIQQIDLAYGMGATFADGPVEEELLRFPRTWVQTITSSPPISLTWASGRGDSMAPTIHDGDIVLLDRSQRRVIEQDALWAYTVGDLGAIKRLRIKGDRVIILSDNPAVPPDEEPIDQVNIVARVIFIGKRT